VKFSRKKRRREVVCHFCVCSFALDMEQSPLMAESDDSGPTECTLSPQQIEEVVRSCITYKDIRGRGEVEMMLLNNDDTGYCCKGPMARPVHDKEDSSVSSDATNSEYDRGECYAFTRDGKWHIVCVNDTQPLDDDDDVDDEDDVGTACIDDDDYETDEKKVACGEAYSI
jgi:hypothetical protein